jgi:dolichol kinase
MPVSPLSTAVGRPRLSTRKIVHMSMLVFAFLLPFLTWAQAAGCAVLALLFNLFLLPRLQVDLSKQPGAAEADLPRPTGSGAKLLPYPAGTWTGIALYPTSVFLLILLYRHHLHIAAAAWAIMALGDGMASVVGEGLRGPTLPWNQEKTWSGFAGFVGAGTAGAYALTRWVNPSLPADKVLIVSAAAALVGAMVETVPIRLDDNLSLPLVSGGFLFCAYLVERSALDSNLPFLSRRMLLALLINAAFALLALALKTVSRSGATVGLILGTVVYLGYGYKSFLLLLSFFLLG